MILTLSVYNSKKGAQRREILRIIGKYRKKGADVEVYEQSPYMYWDENPKEWVPDVMAEMPDGYCFRVVITLEKNNSDRSA